MFRYITWIFNVVQKGFDAFEVLFYHSPTKKTVLRARNDIVANFYLYIYVSSIL